MPHKVSLNGEWRIGFDDAAAWRGDDGRVEWDHVLSAADAPIVVPSCWELLRPDYDGVAWYVHHFEATPSFPEGIARLRFDAVNYLAHVWLNRQYLGTHEGGYTPFELDATAALRESRNELVVRVLNPHPTRVIDGIRAGGTNPQRKNVEIPIGKQIRYGYNFGGIWQNVSLVRTGSMLIEDCFVRSFIQPRRAQMAVTVRMADACRVGRQLRVTVRHKRAGSVYHEQVTALSAPSPDHRVTWSAEIPLPDAPLWHLDDPQLLVVAAQLVDSDGQIADEREDAFGLREFTVREGFFQLNGKPLIVMGGFHQGFYPMGLGAPLDESMFRREIELAKAAGLHLLRYHVKTPHPRLLELADEMGMLLYPEPPIGWMAYTPQMEVRCLREVREMVLRDRNHPSVVIWGMVNEDGRDVLPIIPRLAEEARQYDDSRIIIQNSGRGTPMYLPYEAEPRVAVDESHAYRRTPVDDAVWNELRQVDGFVTESGYGGVFNLVNVVQRYADAGARPDLLDHCEYREGLERFERGYRDYRMDEVFDSVEDLFLATQEIEAVGTRLQTEARRLSPKFAGILNTFLGCGWEQFGMLDMWRQPKQVYHALREACVSLAVILWPTRASVYADEGWSASAWLVNDTGQSLEATVAWQLMLRGATIAQEHTTLKVRPGIQALAPMAFSPEFLRALSAGTYELEVQVTSAAAAPARNRCPWVLLHRDAVTARDTRIGLIVSPAIRETLLNGPLRGVREADLAEAPVTLCQETWAMESGRLNDALALAEQGATVAIVIDRYVKGVDSPVVDEFDKRSLQTVLGLRLHNSEGHFIGYYHYVREHPIFAGLPVRCMMGQPFRDLCARTSMAGTFPAGTEHVVGTFTSTWGGFDFVHSTDLAVIPHGKGRLILTTLPLLTLAGADPIADRLLVNLVHFDSHPGSQ